MCEAVTPGLWYGLRSAHVKLSDDKLTSMWMWSLRSPYSNTKTFEAITWKLHSRTNDTYKFQNIFYTANLEDLQSVYFISVFHCN